MEQCNVVDPLPAPLKMKPTQTKALIFFPFVFCSLLLHDIFHYGAQAGLELSIVRPQTPECWDHSCLPPCLAFFFSGQKCCSFLYRGTFTSESTSHPSLQRSHITCAICGFCSLAFLRNKETQRVFIQSILLYFCI